MFRKRGKIKKSIVNKTLSQNYSADVDKLCSTEEEKPEYTITEQKDKGNEVTYDVTNFNVSIVNERGRNNTDVSYERVYIATSGYEYFTDMLHRLNKYHDPHGQRLSSKKLKEAILHVMEEEEKEIERNINKIT